MNADTPPELSTVEIGPHLKGRGFVIRTRQWLPAHRERVFSLFADAFQLETLTPRWLHFKVLTPPPIEMAVGRLIDYRLQLHGIPITWRTRIAAWEPPFRFVDEQLRGPYRLWHHEHLFEQADAGTLCRDVVHYQPIGGRLLNSTFVRRDLLAIFRHRQTVLANIFEERSTDAARLGDNP